MSQDNPTALHLRGMNMLYEGLKEKGALMIVPSSAIETMGMGGLYGAAALRRSDALAHADVAASAKAAAGYGRLGQPALPNRGDHLLDELGFVALMPAQHHDEVAVGHDRDGVAASAPRAVGGLR